jgi:hypothetical protein
MIDLGQYRIVKDGETYIVTDQLTFEDHKFSSIKDLLSWIENNLTDKEVDLAEDV